MENSNFDINEISAKVITSLATSAGKALFKKVGYTIKDAQQKFEIEFGLSFENYLKCAKDSNEKIKTLLYRHDPKSIRSFSEYIFLKKESDLIDTSDINDVLRIGNNIVVTGTGGAGKSVMMKLLFLDAISKTSYIPVLIELRGLNDYDYSDVCLIDYIFEAMCKRKLNLEKTYFTYSLDAVDYLFLFDGFDELKSDISLKVANQILEMSNKYPENHYIVTSRPSECFIGWNSFQELSTVPFNKSQALKLISKLEYDDSVKEQFYYALDSYLFDKYETFASNPLLLTIMLLTYEKNASVPDKLNDFYEQAFNTLFHEHDATKGGYKRDIKSNLGYEDFRRAFSYFCFKSFFNTDYSFKKSKALEYIQLIKSRRIVDVDFNSEDFLTDLTNSVCVLIHDGLDYKFTHRSFQEYFSALYTMQLDDSSQENLIKVWMSTIFYNENFLKILYELQPKRFIRNVLTPPLKYLQKIVSQHGNSAQYLFCYLYDAVKTCSQSDEFKYIYRISDEYYHNILFFTGTLYNSKNNTSYVRPQLDQTKDDKFAQILIEKFGNDSLISLETLISLGYSEYLSDEFSITKSLYDYSMEFLSSNTQSDSSQNQNILSIIDML